MLFISRSLNIYNSYRLWVGVMQAASVHAPDHRAHVRAVRERKRAQAEAIGIDEVLVDRVVERFYERIRADGLLGPIFAAKISDWPWHLARMKQFWNSVLLGTGEFSGNPMRKHRAIPGLTEPHFSHWLALFYQILREECPQEKGAIEFGERARMIAESLLIGVELEREALTPHVNKRTLPHL
ncbi:MAG: group III truncated hemoglobin [Erythrobacter sp.]